MKFSELWLRQYVNPLLDTASLAHALTMAGLEVEAIEPVAGDFSGVVVGHVRTVMPHPDADRLRVCQVDVGAETWLQIVCGAANVCVDARVPCAVVGARLPGMEIKSAKLRGVASFGMLCSGTELGIAGVSDGLLILPADAPVGLSVREYLRLNDQSLTLKLTPNRSDCLSVQGIAREVAAITGAQLHTIPTAPVSVSGAPGFDMGDVEAVACPRYRVQRLDGLNPFATTPEWMRERLARSGIRSLGAIVDVTNYVLLEMGQPLHAFDADKIHGAIRVRWAQTQESIVLLNGQEVRLDADMLVIADETGAQAIAGIMGGAASAVSESTTSVLLESAYFDPDAVAGRARRLGLATDAAFRFERGVDFGATQQAADRAAELLLSICGGVAHPAIEVLHELPARTPIHLRVARVARILGVALDGADIQDYLQRLGCALKETETGFQVSVPSYRFDLAIEVDLIEELARLYGYDRIIPKVPHADLSMTADSEQLRSVEGLREILVARDYQEVITYSFVDQTWETELAPQNQAIALKNPIASQMSVMRSTLFGGVLDVLDSNLNRGQSRVRVMEVGRCYQATGDGVVENLRVGGLCYGSVAPEQWGLTARNVDFFDVKADLEALCWPEPLQVLAAQHPALHPGQSGQLVLNNQVIGWLGALHPELVRRRQWGSAPIVFEMNVEPLLLRQLPRYCAMSRFQAVRRDLAVIVGQAVSAQTILDHLRAANVPYVTEIALFDSYRGKHIDYDKKSLAFSVHMQDNHKTLTDGEVDAAVVQLTDLMQRQFGAQLRS